MKHHPIHITFNVTVGMADSIVAIAQNAKADTRTKFKMWNKRGYQLRERRMNAKLDTQIAKDKEATA